MFIIFQEASGLLLLQIKWHQLRLQVRGSRITQKGSVCPERNQCTRRVKRQACARRATAIFILRDDTSSVSSSRRREARCHMSARPRYATRRQGKDAACRRKAPFPSAFERTSVNVPPRLDVQPPCHTALVRQHVYHAQRDKIVR